LLRKPEIQGGTFNLGSGRDYSILEIYDRIEGLIQSGLKPDFQPDMPAEAFRTLADIGESVRAGWEPKITIEQGLVDFIAYTKSRLHGEH
jgi:UDP-glucose 4-epimerase